MQFPFGTAALALLIVAVGTGAGVALSDAFSDAATPRPDLVFATFTKEHAAAYAPAIAAFEREHKVKISLQVVSQRALQGRLQSALQVGAEVPDMVEIGGTGLGQFTSGPLEDVGFLDLTDRVRAAGLDKKVLASRFALYESRGRTFALPHDVHPVMLAYRKDLTDALGIDVTKLTTWDAFVRVGREVTTDLDGDGVRDRYMIDLPTDGGDYLKLLMLQRGASIFDARGDVAFDDEATVQTVCWYVRQTAGERRISFACGWGQPLARSMIDGLCLFYVCPDWRTMQFQMDVPGLAGKLALMPLPAWTEGGPRTSTWGATGLAITKQCKQPELAWKLAMHLYYDPEQLGPRFAGTNILPPLVESWSEPEFSLPDPFYGGQQRGLAFVELAPQVPEQASHTYMNAGVGKLSEAFQNVVLYYEKHGDEGLEAYARGELKRCADRVRVIVDRNVFLKVDAAKQAAAGDAADVAADRAAEGSR